MDVKGQIRTLGAVINNSAEFDPGSVKMYPKLGSDGFLTIEISVMRVTTAAENQRLRELGLRFAHKPASVVYAIWEAELERPVSYKAQLKLDLTDKLIDVIPNPNRLHGDVGDLMAEALRIEDGTIKIEAQEDYDYYAARLKLIKAELKQRKAEREEFAQAALERMERMELNRAYLSEELNAMGLGPESLRVLIERGHVVPVQSERMRYYRVSAAA
jgi:hypothetical protein